MKDWHRSVVGWCQSLYLLREGLPHRSGLSLSRGRVHAVGTKQGKGEAMYIGGGVLAVIIIIILLIWLL